MVDAIVKGSYIMLWLLGSGVLSLFLLKFKPTGRIIKNFLNI